MDFTTELLARLQNGESVDSLAAELTKAINDANTENERIKAEAEAKRKADEAAEFHARELARNKAEAIDDLLIALENIVSVWDLGDELVEAIAHVNPDEVVQELDEIIPAAKAYIEMMEKIDSLRETPTGDRSMKTAPDLPAVGDPIEDFLNKFVR